MKKTITIPDFIVVPTKLTDNKEIQSQDALVYGLIQWFHVTQGGCEASTATISHVLNASHKGVQNSIDNLEKHGYIKRERPKENVRKIIPLIKVKGMPVPSTENSKIVEILKCFYCGKEDWTGKMFERDHYVAKSKGGSNNKKNSVLACEECNRRKNTTDGDEFVKHL